MNNPFAFPSQGLGPDGLPMEDHNSGMTLRDYFAAHAAEPTDTEIAGQERLDRNRNPHNDPHGSKIRTRQEVIAFLRYRSADAMLAERAKANPSPDHPPHTSIGEV